METSILTTIKKLLGLPSETDAFDLDIMVHINSVLSTLNQMGIGKTAGFVISDETATWEQFFEDDDLDIPLLTESEEEPGTFEESTETISVDSVFQQQVKSYIYIKVKLLFDPPANGNILSAMKENAKEIETRLYTLKGGY